MKLSKFTILSLLIFNTVVFLSCDSSVKKSLTPPFGTDTDYFLGLQFLEQGKEKQAKQKFLNCMKNGTYFPSKKSAELLTTIGSIQNQNDACEKLLDMFPDEDSVLFVAKHYQKINENQKILDITQNIDLQNSDNELIQIRMQALKAANISSYMDEVYKWFILRPISNYHIAFYTSTFMQSLPVLEEDYSIPEFIINYRVDVYKKNYTIALEKAELLFELFKKAEVEPFSLLVSDIGKAYLYGSSDYNHSAAIFSKYADEFSNFDSVFYFWFYAGRFYEKDQKSYTQTINAFENAISSTKDKDLIDNALWYLLQTKIDKSYSKTISELKHYASQWSKPDYFDDLFESLILSLMVNGNWELFGTLLSQIDGYASNETTAKVAYIYGRLIQEGKIKIKNKELEIERVFTRALNCGISPYYKILSSYRLGYSEQEMERILRINPENEEKTNMQSASNLLLGYKYFGYPEKIYPEWLKLFNLGVVSTETSMELASFLSLCGKSNSDYYPLSIRISSRAANNSSRELTKDDLKLVYPTYYSDLVEQYSKEYNVDKYLMYALIRSESFFDEDVSSVAGAIGLTQLMELTAKDIARKLKKSDYSLLDPKINIQFGTYYISELIDRCDNSFLQALFSYNAGITRVRRWLSSSQVHFGKKKNMPGDLFLETIPYSETREYGRKLVSASLFYEWLYNDHIQDKRTFSEIVESFIY